MTDVVVVESPAKAKTIKKYLGGNFTILASFGHVRDLSPKDGSVKPDDNFAMVWQTDERGRKHMADIARALKNAQTLYLATDPDREGEAISWHVRSILEEKKALKNIDVKRVTFNEITKNAITHAMKNPRGLDYPLIDAYLTRRALDYLVGFSLSPVLWRKLPGSRSAGRVQSVALRLICERESEIELFKPKEYWTVDGLLKTKEGKDFTARLTHLDGKKLEQFSLPNEQTAQDAKNKVLKAELSVASVVRKKARRHPKPPFTTSTLQQEASRKLGMRAQITMRVAQQLYEGLDIGGETVGLISYMRTDGVSMAQEAIVEARDYIKNAIGSDYLPDKQRVYKTKAKNAQEAHEGIRPTSMKRTPQSIAAYLNKDQLRLYTLIWKRAVASQMESAILDQVSVDVSDSHKDITLRATGSIIAFDGFLKLYQEGTDDRTTASELDNKLLPDMNEGDATTQKDVITEQHFTQPPPRFSEASLVKKLEELGIGRPSTYASIISVLQTRDYVYLEKRRFIPHTRGRLVTAFLISFFERYVDTDFTAHLETCLDEISAGQEKWKEFLAKFWENFSKAITQAKDRTITEVIDALNNDLEPFLFPKTSENDNPRKCPSCDDGQLGLKLGKYGAFIGCSNYPECRYTRLLTQGNSNGQQEEKNSSLSEPRILGTSPRNNLTISLRNGPWGPYLQEDNPDEEDKKKPKRISLPKDMSPQEITLEQADALLSLPRSLGEHPKTHEQMEAGLGRFGPYVKMGDIFASLPKDKNVLFVTHDEAIEFLDKKLSSITFVGKNPENDEMVSIRKGRFGPYLQQGKTIASLPKETDPQEITLEEAINILKERGKTRGAKGKKTATKQKTSTSKKASTTKKKTTKTVAKKKASK